MHTSEKSADWGRQCRVWHLRWRIIGWKVPIEFTVWLIIFFIKFSMRRKKIWSLLHLQQNCFLYWIDCILFYLQSRTRKTIYETEVHGSKQQHGSRHRVHAICCLPACLQFRSSAGLHRIKIPTWSRSKGTKNNIKLIYLQLKTSWRPTDLRHVIMWVINDMTESFIMQY